MEKGVGGAGNGPLAGEGAVGALDDAGVGGGGDPEDAEVVQLLRPDQPVPGGGRMGGVGTDPAWSTAPSLCSITGMFGQRGRGAELAARVGEVGVRVGRSVGSQLGACRHFSAKKRLVLAPLDPESRPPFKMLAFGCPTTPANEVLTPSWCVK